MLFIASYYFVIFLLTLKIFSFNNYKKNCLYQKDNSKLITKTKKCNLIEFKRYITYNVVISHSTKFISIAESHKDLITATRNTREIPRMNTEAQGITNIVRHL